MINSREEYVGELRSLAVMFAQEVIAEAEFLDFDKELRVAWKEFKANTEYVRLP